MFNQRKVRGRPNLNNFDRERGESQSRGSLGVYAVQPSMGSVPIGPAPPNERQVVSVYSARPIGGYDMCLSGSFSTYNSLPQVSVTTPIGYSAIVRRIEIESSPAFLATTDIAFTFQSAGVFQPGWRWSMGKVLTERSIDVFFPVPSNTSFGIKEVGGGFTGTSTVVVVYVRFVGNLLLDDSTPVTQQVGSLPHGVRVLNKE